MTGPCRRNDVDLSRPMQIPVRTLLFPSSNKSSYAPCPFWSEDANLEDALAKLLVGSSTRPSISPTTKQNKEM